WIEATVMPGPVPPMPSQLAPPAPPTVFQRPVHAPVPTACAQPCYTPCTKAAASFPCCPPQVKECAIPANVFMGCPLVSCAATQPCCAKKPARTIALVCESISGKHRLEMKCADGTCTSCVREEMTTHDLGKLRFAAGHKYVHVS